MEQLQIDGGLIYRLKNGANHDEINVTMVDGSRANDMLTAGAMRVLDCINACAGIDKPELWVAQMKYMDSDHTISLDIIQKLTQQNDELLAALKEVTECLDAQITGKGGFAVEEVIEDAMLAIAKAELSK